MTFVLYFYYRYTPHPTPYKMLLKHVFMHIYFFGQNMIKVTLDAIWCYIYPLSSQI